MLKGDGSAGIGESHCGFDAPGAVPRSVRNLAGVVPLESLAQILGVADIEMPRIIQTLKDIDVMKRHTGLPGRSSQRWLVVVRFSPSSLRYDAAAFGLRCAANEDWRERRGSNP